MITELTRLGDVYNA